MKSKINSKDFIKNNTVDLSNASTNIMWINVFKKAITESFKKQMIEIDKANPKTTFIIRTINANGALVYILVGKKWLLI